MVMKLLDPGQIVKTVYDDDKEAFKVSQIGGSLVPELYDTIELTYVASGNGAGEIQTVTYSLAGDDVALLTLAYDGSNRLASVTRS